MQVTDILVGDSKVRVETSNGAYEYDKISEEELSCSVSETPETVRTVLENEGFELVDSFPKTITRYIHDEPSSRDYSDIAEKLDLDSDDGVVQRIANFSYEVKLTIEATDKNTAKLTHIDDEELATPKIL